MPEKIIDINSIRHIFSDGYIGIKDISLSIHKGEFIILAGKNGSLKTIGMVFQDADTQIVGDTVFDEVAFGLENLKVKRDKINEKVTQVLENLNLSHLKQRNPSTLSGGEKRKLAIAGILVMDPQVIAFDEPFSNLDYPGTLQVLSTIIDLNQSGHTIIMATHDVEPIICEATRIIIMENGQVKKDGTPDTMVMHLESFGVREPCSSKFGLGLLPWPT